MMTNTDKNKKLWLTLALLLLAAIAYWQSLQNGFVLYDDDVYVTQNAEVQSGVNGQTLAWALTSTSAANWHPLTWISHLLDYQFYGLNPAGHHFTSVLLHLANVALLLWALHYLTGSIWRSAFVAALFAVHPLNVESVAWVAERKNVLSTLFWILTIWSYAWYARRPEWRRYLLVVLIFAMGLMAKPMLVTLPFVLLLLDYWPLRRWPWQAADNRKEATVKSKRRSKKSPENTGFSTRSWLQLIIEKAPLLVVAAASSAITFFAQKQGGAVASVTKISLAARLENAIVAYADYLYQMLWPTGLAVFYPHPKGAIPLWQFLLALVALLLITGFVLWKARRFAYLPVGWFYYLGTLVPVIGIVQVGEQARADRYAYVPLIGIFILVVWGGGEVLKKFPQQRNAIIGVAIGWLIVLTVVTRTQVRYWRDSATLFRRAVSVTENNYLAYNNLGEALALQGKVDEAAKEFETSIAINPQYDKAQHNLGMALLQQKKPDDAIDHLYKAVEINPNFYDAYNKLGAALVEVNRFEEAEANLDKALELHPGYASAYANLGILMEKQKRTDDALAAYTNALKFSANNAMSAQMRYKLGSLYEKRGEVQEAIQQYREALKLAPNHKPAQQSLNQLLERTGKP
ncbi:MAG: tetratricopeptide repeat protein [Acidobacteria bacterium]|nr:tetratricopeptide repeat protein [Acidobacteriota bacterium]